ncbi:gustatory receptor [Homalodisca vitripennis]|nr:gustatory receptor [Homalodisca vitripennis]
MGFPLKYTSKSSTCRKLTFSAAVFWWGLAMTVLQTGFMISDIYTNFSREHALSLNTSTSIFALTTTKISTILTEIVVFASWALKYSKLLNVCNTLQGFDRNLRLAPPESSMTVKATVLVMVFLIIPISYEGAYLYMTLASIEDHESNTKYIINFICLFVAYCRQICLLAQFQEVTHHIAKRFRLINASIRQELIIQRYRQTVRLINRNRNQDSSSSRKIKSFMNAYQMLRDAVHQTNYFYCDIILSLMFHKFVHITMTLYLFFTLLVSESPVSYTRAGIWISCHVCYLLVFVSSSTDVTEAADETAPIIRKIINKGLDRDLTRQLEYFLLELSTQNVVFSAKGFFQISRQMLTTIVASMAVRGPIQHLSMPFLLLGLEALERWIPLQSFGYKNLHQLAESKTLTSIAYWRLNVNFFQLWGRSFSDGCSENVEGLYVIFSEVRLSLTRFALYS